MPSHSAELNNSTILVKYSTNTDARRDGNIPALPTEILHPKKEDEYPVERIGKTENLENTEERERQCHVYRCDFVRWQVDSFRKNIFPSKIDFNDGNFFTTMGW